MSTKDVKLRVNLSALLLSSTALCLVSGNSHAFPACAAGSLCYYVAVQPIDVCSDTGTNCAPFNTLSKVGNPGAATSTTPIGFVDTTTGKDVTRAIWNQIGVDIAWSPMAQYKKTQFQTINIVQCSTTTLPCATTNPTGDTSLDFLTLSQQPQISQSTPGFPNPNLPNAPVSSQPTIVNMFFTNTLNPPPGTTGPLYGFAWINNNGLVIGKNTFFPPSSLQKPRFDTLAHELGHNLGGDHITFGAGQPPNLLTAGANGTGMVLRTEPTSASDALTRLGPGESCTPPPNSTACTADQLDTSAMVMPSQQDEADMSGLLNPIASSTTSASKPGTAGAAATALVVTTTGNATAITNAPAASTTSKPDTSIIFDVVGPSQGAAGETLLGAIITLGPGVKFDPSNTVRFTTNRNLVNETDYNNGNEEDRDCPMSDTHCLTIQLKKPGLPQGQDLIFSQGIILAQRGDEGDDGGDGAKKPVTLNQLQAAGVYVTYLFSDGLVITSQLSGPNSAGQLTGDSHHPTGVVPTQFNPNFLVSNTGAKPCVPNASGLCESPAATGGQDGDPRCESPAGGGHPPPAYGPPPYGPPLPVSCPVPYGG